MSSNETDSHNKYHSLDDLTVESAVFVNRSFQNCANDDKNLQQSVNPSNTSKSKRRSNSRPRKRMPSKKDQPQTMSSTLNARMHTFLLSVTSAKDEDGLPLKEYLDFLIERIPKEFQVNFTADELHYTSRLCSGHLKTKDVMGKKKAKKLAQWCRERSSEDVNIQCLPIEDGHVKVDRTGVIGQTLSEIRTHQDKILLNNLTRIQDLESKLESTSQRLNDIIKELDEGNLKKQKLKNLLGEKDRLEGIQKVQTFEVELNKRELNEFDLQCREISLKIQNLDAGLSDSEFKAAISHQKSAFGAEIGAFEKHLPIYGYRHEIIESVEQNQVTVLVAETGSGKSTQIVQYLLRDTMKGLIACTQPRKIAAVSLATHVAQCLGSTVGHHGTVSYNVTQHHKEHADQTKIVFHTDHSLLKAWARDPSLSAFEYVVVDEAHERSLATDLLLSVLRQTLKDPTRAFPLKIIVTSATIDPKIFVDYFSQNSVTVLNVPGKLYPIEYKWSTDSLNVNSDSVKAAVEKAYEIVSGCSNEEAYGILCFLSTPNDCEKAQNKLRELLVGNRFNILQLHGKLQLEDQKKIFLPLKHKEVKIIFATNSAETSITVPGIRFVIDTGIAKERHYDPKRNVSLLKLGAINKSSARQRAGRAGRTGPGTCYRLYTEADHESFQDGMVPEIKRLPLDQCILQLFELGIKDPEQFEFIETPDRDGIKSSLESLKHLGAVNFDAKSYALTPLGKKMAKFNMDPRLSRMILRCEEEAPEILFDCVVISAVFANGGNVFFRHGTDDVLEEADARRLLFCHPKSDFFTMLSVFKEWSAVPDKNKSKWCGENFINGKSMKAIRTTIKEIDDILKNMVEKPMHWESHCDVEEVEEKLGKIIFTCFEQNLAIYSGHPFQGYISLRSGESMRLHPSSSVNYLNAKIPKYIIYEQVMTTSQTFVINISPVNEEWLLEDVINACETSPWITNQMVSAVEAKPIGNVILRRHFLGKGAAIKKALEDDLQTFIDNHDSTGKTRFLKMEISVEKGYILVHCHKSFHAKVKMEIEIRLSNAIDEMEHETMRLPLMTEGRSSMSLIIRSGGTVLEPFLPFDYTDISIREPSDPFRLEATVPQIFPDARLKFLEDGRALLCWKLPSEAKKAFKFLTDRPEILEALDLKISQVTPKRSMELFDQKPVLSIGLGLQRRLRRNFGFIEFKNEIYASQFWSHYAGSILVGSTYVRITPAKNSPTSIRMVPLPSEITDEEIQAAIDAKVYGKVTVKLVHEAPFETTEENLVEMTTAVEEFISIQGRFPKQAYDVRVLPRKNTDTMWRIFINFQCVRTGVDVVRLLKLDLHHLSVGTKAFPVKSIDYKISSSVVTSKDILEKVKPEVMAIIGKNEHEIKPGKNNRITILLNSRNADDLYITRIQLQEVLGGETISHPNLRHIVNTMNWEKVLDLLKGKECDVVLRRNFSPSSPSITIYGRSASVSLAKIEINRFLGGLLDKNTSSCSIRFAGPGIPRGALKILMKEYENDFTGIKEMDGILEVKVSLKRKRIEIAGTKEAIEKIQRESEELLQRELFSHSEDTEECCQICFTEPEGEDRYRFEGCGHLICLSCFRMQVTSGDLPLLCSDEACQKNIVVQDLKVIFENDQAMKDKFSRTTLEKFLSQTKDYGHCPTPDCGGIFPREYEERTKELVFHCVSCKANICTRCGVIYHVGYSCADFEILNGDKDGSLKVWMRSDPINHRLCPTCRAPIEKNGGCKHVTCTKCGSHICWQCMCVFPTGTNVYDHLGYCRENPNRAIFD